MRSPAFLNVPALLIALLLTLALGGCDSAEEKAQKHYLSGVALAEAGDVPRALIELRNAFTYDPRHPQARLVYARLMRDAGDLGEAYAQYQRVIETAPDTVEARRALAEMAIVVGDWPEAERHNLALQRIDPASPATELVTAALAYRTAVLARDARGAAAATQTARRVLRTDPAALIARHIVIDHVITTGDAKTALAEIDAALAVLPAERDFHTQRVRILAGTRDAQGLGTALAAFVAQFPDDAQARQMMIAWYIDAGDLDAAEAFLRQLADDPASGGLPPSDGPDGTGPDGTGPDGTGTSLAARMTLIEFVIQARGAQAGRVELDRRIAAERAAGADPLPYLARRAALDFDDGRRAAGIAALTALLAGAATPAQTTADTARMRREIKVTLARMLLAEGDATGARVRIDEVLADDPAHVAALKLRASWLIDDDRPAEAITALRTALAAAPRDAEILMLTGRAHDRDGAHELAGESYARAVEAAGRAPAESIFYAGFLAQDARFDSAAAVLGDALRLAPRNIDLLSALAQIRLRQKNLAAAAEIAATLRQLDDPGVDGPGLDESRAEAAALAIEAETLLLQDRVDETIALLQDIATTDAPTDGRSIAAAVRMVQVQINAGKRDEARAFLDDRLRTDAADPRLRFLRAGIHVLDAEPGKAEAIYRDLLARAPTAEPPLRALYGLLHAAGRKPEATALLQASLAAAPKAVLPRLMLATEREALGDIEGAIALYEALYAEDSGNLVVANNLASLLAGQYRGGTDTVEADSVEADAAGPDSAGPDAAEPMLERAATIARRLRGSQVPAFQDTYGWLETLRGNPAGALRDLQSAARGLPDDALVHYHLGMTHLALGQDAEARRVLSQALTLAGSSPLPAFAEARARLTALGGP